MKCPVCGAWSSVLATRGAHRRRECANGHRFTSIEVVPSVVHAKDYRAYVRGVAERAKTWPRDRRILEDSRSSTVVAREYGITPARVRQIRAREHQARNVL